MEIKDYGTDAVNNMRLAGMFDSQIVEELKVRYNKAFEIIRNLLEKQIGVVFKEEWEKADPEFRKHVEDRGIVEVRENNFEKL